ncbi:hypothetical protein B0H11DRAFT_2248336 [Mycena galericulata]|nr:hypothetical protein B0H11DRAFT_2265161 [Mycena galericulata]KAJ7447610.1 hypothetical protein B0H11DRAFT_2248336 [Mycena galericulata]
MPPSELDLEFDAELDAAATADSPVRNPLKRRLETDNQDEDEHEDDELPASPTVANNNPASSANSSDANKNVLAFAKQYATHKRLKPSQITEVESFAADPIATRQIKLFTVLLGVDTRLEAIRTAAPEFKVTAALDKNMHTLAIHILLSPQISAYKGDFPTKVLLDILKKKRFDLPPGIELVSSDWSVVKARAEYWLTQARAHFKKLLKTSVAGEDTKKHSNIFVLGQRFVRDTETTLTTPLCARIALMRKCFKLYPAENFWDKLDGRLASIREKADGDATKQTKMFKSVLEADRSAHGVRDEYDLPDDAVVDERQNEVDTVVERVV